MSGRPDTGLSTLTIHRKCCGNFAILRCPPILAALRVVGVLSCAGNGWHKAVQLQQTAAVTTALRELLQQTVAPSHFALRTSHFVLRTRGLSRESPRRAGLVAYAPVPPVLRA